MTTVRISDGHYGEDVELPDGTTPAEMAAEWLRTGNWGDVESTTWLRATVYALDEDGERGEQIGAAVLTLEPPDPQCAPGTWDNEDRNGTLCGWCGLHNSAPDDLNDDGLCADCAAEDMPADRHELLDTQPHDWQHESTRGNGGGVIVTERCWHCGTERVTDTWAHDPETGEQGLTSVSYVVPSDGGD